MLYYLITVLHLFNSGIAWFLFICLLWKLLGRKCPGPPNPEAAFTVQPQESQPEMGSKSCSVALLPHVWCGVHGEKGLCHLLCSHWISTAVLVGLDRFTGWEKAASSRPHHLVSCKKGSSQKQTSSSQSVPHLCSTSWLILSFLLGN